mgnify:CR=1 FL=1
MIGLSLSAYLSQVILPILMVVAISVLLTFGVHLMLPSGWLRVVACTLMSVIAVTAAVFTVGLTSSERTFILSLIKPPHAHESWHYHFPRCPQLRLNAAGLRIAAGSDIPRP